MAVPAISLKQLSKKYGSSRGVEDLNLEVQKGEIFGFLGPNGAGKTTTIRLLLDSIRPTSGQALVLGLDSHKNATDIHARVGYLASDMEMDRKLTGRQYLEYVANLRGNVPWSSIQKLIDRLECQVDKKISTLSRGNKQKIGLVAALMHDPDVLIFDEPTSGLDPLIQQEFQKIVRELRRRGKTIFISSHVLGEIQEICDHVGFIREGRLVDVQPLASLRRKAFKNVRVSLSRSKANALAGLKGVEGLHVTKTTVQCKFHGNYQQLMEALSKLPVKDVTIEEASLEDLFFHYYEAKEETPDA